MSIKEIQERHDAMDDYVNEVADAESYFSDAEPLFVETHRHRKELLDATEEYKGLWETAAQAALSNKTQAVLNLTRSLQAEAALKSLTTLIKEADEYLDINDLTSIGHSSIFHQAFKAILDKL